MIGERNQGWIDGGLFASNTGDGVFYVNSKLRTGQVEDGLSNTFAFAEVKAFTPYIRNTSDPGPTIPDEANQLPTEGQKKLGPDTNNNTGHTEWPDGGVGRGVGPVTHTLNPKP